MMTFAKNIILIGMPGVGKSTVGVLLAKRLGLSFVDTDILIQVREGRSLQAIIQSHGAAEFCRIEEDHILSLSPPAAASSTAPGPWRTSRRTVSPSTSILRSNR
jgi:shikimate kinase